MNCYSIDFIDVMQNETQKNKLHDHKFNFVRFSFSIREKIQNYLTLIFLEKYDRVQYIY